MLIFLKTIRNVNNIPEKIYSVLFLFFSKLWPIWNMPITCPYNGTMMALKFFSLFKRDFTTILFDYLFTCLQGFSCNLITLIRSDNVQFVFFFILNQDLLLKPFALWHYLRSKLKCLETPALDTWFLTLPYLEESEKQEHFFNLRVTVFSMWLYGRLMSKHSKFFILQTHDSNPCNIIHSSSFILYSFY